ncbi:hypothetical protein V6233_22820 [Vibrio antiquarius]
MSDKSVELAKLSLSGSTKYDYFMVGIAATTFSYFAKDFRVVGSFGFNEHSFILVALLLLSLSVVSGLKKLNGIMYTLRKMGN